MKHKLRWDNKAREAYLDGEYLSPNHSQAIYNHSPDGFMVGYSGSGPAQLSLAILLKLGADKGIAVAQHQQFKRDLIAKLPQNKDFEVEFEWPTKERDDMHSEDHFKEVDMHPAHPDDK